MSEFTFLTKEQVFGEDKLDILKKYGVKAAMTDFSILLGGAVFNDYIIEKDKTNETIFRKTGGWWTKTTDIGYIMHTPFVYYVSKDGLCFTEYLDSYIEARPSAVGARPALPYSIIKDFSTNKVRDKNGILEVEYGEYPQTIVSGGKNILESLCNAKRL